MRSYTIKKGSYPELPALEWDGPPYAMAMLLRCIYEGGEPFVTYGAIARELEYRWNVRLISPRQIGKVAGSLMDAIENIDPEAPLINVMITNDKGIPGSGVGGYLENRYNKPRYKNWDDLRENDKRKLIENERQKILSYKKWIKISEKLNKHFGIKAKIKPRNGRNGSGGGESEEHKKLKKWVAKNPTKISVPASYGEGKLEVSLLSGDSVDVMFSDGDNFVTVEVKSCRSNNDDFRRGIYQCVKYRAVKQAEYAPSEINVKAILVTERKLNSELKCRAKKLDVKTKCVLVNKN